MAQMSRSTRRKIASMGGTAAHEKGMAPKWDAVTARSAGSLGGRYSHWPKFYATDKRALFRVSFADAVQQLWTGRGWETIHVLLEGDGVRVNDALELMIETAQQVGNKMLKRQAREQLRADLLEVAA